MGAVTLSEYLRGQVVTISASGVMEMRNRCERTRQADTYRPLPDLPCSLAAVFTNHKAQSHIHMNRHAVQLFFFAPRKLRD